MRSLKSFRLTLATQLIGNYCTRKRAGRPRSTHSMPHPPALLSPLEHNGPSTSHLHLPSHHEVMHLLPGVQAHQSKARDSLVLQRLWRHSSTLPNREGRWVRLFSAMAQHVTRSWFCISIYVIYRNLHLYSGMHYYEYCSLLLFPTPLVAIY